MHLSHRCSDSLRPSVVPAKISILLNLISSPCDKLSVNYLCTLIADKDCRKHVNLCTAELTESTDRIACSLTSDIFDIAAGSIRLYRTKQNITGSHQIVLSLVT